MRAARVKAVKLGLIEDARSFAALEQEWESLYHNSPLATPFQSWAWLYSWWEFYGEGYELRLVTLRDAELDVVEHCVAFLPSQPSCHGSLRS